MFFDILTLFPEMFKGPLTESILKRAQENNIIDIETINIRDFAEDKHNTADEPPYGGGAGMVLKPQPIYKAWQSASKKREKKAKTILMSPQGKKLDQNLVKELSQNDGFIIICGRYEGVDERIRQTIVDEEISIGDFVLTGGELPAMVLIDAVSRMVSGVLGDDNSPVKDSFYKGLLEHPHYTRPREFRGMQVPDVLLSGNHKMIEDWRRRESLKRTLIRRPDLLKNKDLSPEDIKIIEQLKKELEELKGEINENN